jgi:hypothetical protein
VGGYVGGARAWWECGDAFFRLSLRCVGVLLWRMRLGFSGFLDVRVDLGGFPPEFGWGGVF